MSQDLFRVRVSGPLADVLAFLAAHPLEAQGTRIEGGIATLDLFVTDAQRAELQHRGLRIDRSFNATANGQVRSLEVGRGNRFADGSHPRGLGVKVR